MASASLSPDTIMSETLTVKLEQIERIDRLASIEENRFAATLRELDRHQSVRAEIRRAAAMIEDAEFEDIPAPAKTLPGGAA